MGPVAVAVRSAASIAAASSSLALPPQGRLMPRRCLPSPPTYSSRCPCTHRVAEALDARHTNKPDIVNRIRVSYDDVGGWPAPGKLPVVYSPAYNIRFWGIENLHPFDSKKFQHIVRLLERDGVLAARQLAEPALASQQILADVHTQAYLDKLNTSSLAVAWVCELPVLAFLPSFVTRRKVLHPMATMAAGTMLAAALAMEHGWAINLGGGMHHASHDKGGGWCTYADPYLAIRRLREASGGLVKRVLVVDLDVHQGNGIERCKLHFQDQDVRIVDVYNAEVYPFDTTAKQGIDVRRELGCGTGDEAYLEAVEGALRQAFEGQPRFDLLLYNAGTDVLEGDPLGRLRVSTEGVRRRDELVWAAALEHGTPIVQVLSGGYTRASTPCIAASIASLFRRFGLGAAAAAGAGGGV